MSTIEHNKYCFWDWDSIFPGPSVSDAFTEAGGRVEYVGPSDLIVSGLSLKQALEIASEWNADYMGPYVVKDISVDDMIDVTPKMLPALRQ